MTDGSIQLEIGHCDPAKVEIVSTEVGNNRSDVGWVVTFTSISSGVTIGWAATLFGSGADPGIPILAIA